LEAAWAAAVEQNEQAISESKALIEVNSPLPEVLAHETVLAQVLANVLSNALKFVQPGVIPHVRFRVETRPESIRLWIEDNGIGIAKEHHERVFRVFERLNEKQFPGTGIGLSIVRKGVERMGGRVGIHSQVGGGSQVWIDLPRVLCGVPLP
jgi:signal transduction histidine kinase